MSEVSEVFSRIEKNYRYLNQMMVEEIDIASPHGGISGNHREEMWIKFFRSIVPLKYSIAQGVIIIDSKGKRSREVDIAVYDEAYTPYVFQYNTLKFIPIEAVVVAIECKSSNWKDEALKDWATDIRKLKPSPSGIARIVSGYATGITNETQKRSRPILILATNYTLVQQEGMDTIKKELGNHFDFIILKQAESQSQKKQRSFELLVKHEEKKLGWWGKRLNEASDIEDEQDITDECLSIIPDRLSKTIWEHTTEEDFTKHVKKLSAQFEELSFCYEKENKTISIANTLLELRIEQNPLLTLNFQLNQLLMLINNPMMFPHFAYAKVFQSIIEE